MVVPLWDLEAGQYSLSADVSIHLSNLAAEETHLWLPIFAGGGGGGDGQGARASSGVARGGDGAGDGFSPLASWRERMAGGRGLSIEGRDRDGESVGQGKGVCGWEQINEDSADGAQEAGRPRDSRGGGGGACGGGERAIQEWRDKQQGEKRARWYGCSGASDVEDERRWGRWNCTGTGGEMDGGGGAQGLDTADAWLDTANAHVLWASTQATFALETLESPLVTECVGLGPPKRWALAHKVIGSGREFMPQIFTSVSDVRVKSDADGLRKDLFDWLSTIGVFTNRYVVNFGCWLMGREPNHSMWYDVATGLMMERGWSGLGFDIDSRLTLIRKVAAERNRHNLTFIAELLTGETAPPHLRAYNVPIDLDLLKVDIDSFDCDLARGILLNGFRPKMLHIEFSPVWPRGVRVEYIYGPKVVPFVGGCSCEAVAALGQEYGYTIISAYGIDVTMIRSDLWHQHGLAKHLRRFGCSPSCGTEYCREGHPYTDVDGTIKFESYNLPCTKWSILYDQGRHEELVKDVAQLVATGSGTLAHSGNIAHISSDHVDVEFLVSDGSARVVLSSSR